MRRDEVTKKGWRVISDMENWIIVRGSSPPHKIALFHKCEEDDEFHVKDRTDFDVIGACECRIPEEMAFLWTLQRNLGKRYLYNGT